MAAVQVDAVCGGLPRKVQLSCGVPTVWQGVRAEIEKGGAANETGV